MNFKPFAIFFICSLTKIDGKVKKFKFNKKNLLKKLKMAYTNFYNFQLKTLFFFKGPEYEFNSSLIKMEWNVSQYQNASIENPQAVTTIPEIKIWVLKDINQVKVKKKLIEKLKFR